MRILRINGSNVDIDQKTAIGITLQAYDFTSPGNRKVNLSNSFSIPLTATNQKIIGYANNIQSLDTTIYDSFTCDYWIDNEHLIKDAKVRIDEISDRIKLYVYNKEDFWDELKDYYYQDFQDEFLEWLRTEKGVHALTDEGVTFYTGTFTDFIAQYINTTENLLIPYYFGNLFQYEPGGEGTGFLEDESNIYLNSSNGGKGGHVCAYAKTIFEFLEFKFSVSFLTGSVDPEIIWNDVYAPKIFLPIRDLIVQNFGAGNQWVFSVFPTTAAPFYPYEDTNDKPDKTMYDFVRAFMQLFNVILDEDNISNVLTIEMRRFDDIETLAEVVDFSGKLDLSKTKYKPSISGYGQKNRIKYEVIYPGGNELAGSKTITCNNKNLDLIKDLFKIDAYYPNVVVNTALESVINISTEESFETFTFLISAGLTTNAINVKIGSAETTSVNLQLSAIYGISGEYSFINSILAYPKFYTIEKWLSITDITQFKFFKQYFIQELGASFFINKISGFNPEKSNKPTKIELIKISDKAPKPIGEYLESFYVDGVGNAFVDGAGLLVFNDFHLPSKDELNLMYINLKAEGVGDFGSPNYLSSSELSSVFVHIQNFDSGNQVNTNKSDPNRVRACRSFTAAAGAYDLRDTGPAGGLIFYVNGTDYLEAAPSDQSVSQAWSNITNVLIGTTGTAIGTGQANTTAIINQAGHTDSAALLCDELSISVDTDNDNYFI